MGGNGIGWEWDFREWDMGGKYKHNQTLHEIVVKKKS
jgi:hypothetical protein